jgi:hypothetical protein
VELSLANDPRTTIRWYRVYLLVSAVASLVVGLAWAGVLAVGGSRCSPPQGRRSLYTR